MGGVAKAASGALSTGGLNKSIKGENSGPSESTIKNAQLWPDLRDPVYRAIQDASSLYKQGYSVPKMNQRQWAGIEGIEDWANQFGGQLGDVSGNIANIAQGNRAGDAPGQAYLQSLYQHPQGDSSSQNFFERVYGQGGTPKEGWDTLRGAIDLADDQSGGLDWLRETAGGSMLGQNPYVDNVIKSMNRSTTDAYGNAIAGMEGSMSRAGGMGGSMEALLRGRENEGFTRALAENEANVRYADYGKERGYQEAARQALPQAHATEVGTMLNAGNAMNDVAMQRLQAQMAAAQQAQQGDWQQQQARMAAAEAAGEGYRKDIQQQIGAGSLLPQLGQAGFMPGTQLLNAGEYTRANLEKQNNAGWTGLQNYLSQLGNVKNLFGSGGGTIQQPPSANAQAFGNAMMLAQMFGPSMMGGGAPAQPTPAASGSAMTGGQALSGWSDRRLKTDIEEVGHGLYRWRYIWGGPLYEGPMAQDVRAVAPELVGEVGGYLTIPAALIREVP